MAGIARDLISLAMTADVVQNGKEGEKVNGHEALDLAETVRVHAQNQPCASS